MTTDQKRACALVRVSSEEQARGGYGLEFQEHDIRAFCSRNNLNLVEVFRDEGFSGATAERPGFKQAMEWARARRFDILVVWKLDRLFRDTRLTLQTVDELTELDIEVRSVQETFTHDSNGRFLLTIFAAGAEKERKDIALRMYSGRITAAKRGTWINGGGTPPYGYRYDPSVKKLVIDQYEAPIVRRLYRWLVEEKLSLYKVQRRINELHIPTKHDRLGRKKPTGSTHWWNKRTLGRILSNEIYTGTFTFRKYKKVGSARTADNLRSEDEWITIRTPSVISRSLFLKAQQQLKQNALLSPRRTKELYLLRGLLVCGQDHRRMQAARRPADCGRECKYYFCSGIRKDLASVRCPSRAVSESRLAPPVWAKLVELLSNPTMVLRELATCRDEALRTPDAAHQASLLERRSRSLLERKARLVELYLAGSVTRDFFQAEQARLQRETDQIARELQRLQAASTSAEQLTAATENLRELYELYRAKLLEANDEVKRDILQTFVKSIVVRNEDLEIEVALPPADCFAGQSMKRLSRKTIFPIYLRTKLVPISEIFRQKGLHKNFSRETA